MKFKSFRSIRTGIAGLLAATALFSCLTSAGAATFSLSGGGFSLSASPTANLTPTSASGVIVPNGVYYLALHDDRSLGLNVIFASTQADAATIGVDPLNGEHNESFRIVNRGGGYISLHPLHAESLALNALLGANCEKGSLLTLHAYADGDDASWWLPVLNRDSSYTFVNAASGLALDLANGDCQTVGNGILVYTRNNFLPAQGWHVYKVNDPKAAQRDPEYLNISSGGSASSAEAAILARLNAMIDGSYGNGAYKVNTTYTGAFANEQCKGFAKKVHMILFGYNIGSTKAKPNNYQISISTSKTRLVGSLTSLSSRSDAALQALLTQARPGDFLQVRRSHGGSHSMIVLSANSSGITVYECNVDGANGIRTATYSWASFRSANAAVSLYTAKDYSLH